MIGDERMKAVIIGWYGTETIGDRAILDGITTILNNYNTDKIYIGSLYPFYTERTLFEEREALCENNKIEIECFNVFDRCLRKAIIADSQVVIFGGGPLMENPEIDVMIRCFEIANRSNVPCIILGCGIEAIYHERYKKAIRKLFDLSSLIVLRDDNSYYWLNNILNIQSDVKVIGDPALISIQKYKRNHSDVSNKEYIAINFREFPKEGYTNGCVWDKYIYARFIDKIHEKLPKYELLLVPMSTFLYDDRLYLNRISLECEYPVRVINKPLNLRKTYEVFANAYGCIGMRHHAVAIQSILNGNNIVLDYTEKDHGKTDGLIKYINGEEFYSNRTIRLQNRDSVDFDHIIKQLSKDCRFQCRLNNIYKEYIDLLGDYLL